MRFFEIINEAKVGFTKADFDKAVEDSEFGVVYVTITGNGEMYIGDLQQDDHPDASYRRRLRLTLVPKKKEVDVYQGSFGSTLRPKLQQALRSLRDAGIIDNTWNFKTTSQAAYHKDGKFTYFPNPVDEKGLDALTDKAIRLSPVTSHITLYHGTSSIDWIKIQKVGLHPLGYGSNTEHGSESRGKHDGNRKVLYLAGSVSKAEDYAKLRVAYQNKKLHGSEYIHDKNNEMVILSVEIPDPSRLVADDDIVNRLARDIARKIWQQKPQEERNKIISELKQKHGFNPNDDVAQMLWRETDNGFNEIFNRIPSKVFKAWKASLTRENQVGYKGIIPPKFLTRIL